MGDTYRSYGEARQPADIAGKRPRSEFDVLSGHEFPSHIAHDDERAGRDTHAIGASYDQYLQSTISGRESTRHLNASISSRSTYPIEDSRPFGFGLDPSVTPKGRPELSPLPLDASNTLFVEGLPPSCSRREVSHIFRPFVGYKEVRLVTKEAKHQDDRLVLCFVDFASPAHAATAMDALQGYKFDELDRDSAYLRIQFARQPGLKTGGGHRRRR